MADNIIDYEQLKTFRYNLDVTIVGAGKGEEVLEDYNIKGFLVENSYSENFFPILKLDMYVSDELYYRLQSFKDKFKVRVSIKRFVIENREDYEKQAYDESKIMYSYVLRSVIFQPFMLDVNPFRNKDLQEENQDRDEQKDLLDNKEGDFRPLELYLFCNDHLNLNKRIINAIIQDNTITNTIGYVFNEVGINSVIMDIPENKQKYEQILLPPFNFKNTIEYLANSHGIFKTGIRQFLDFDTYYLLSNDLNQVPIKMGEYENVFINIGKISNVATHAEGCYRDDKNRCYIVNLPNNVNYATQGTLSKEIDGTKTRVYSMGDMIESTKYDDKTGKFTFGKGYEEAQAKIDGYESKDDKVSYAYNHMENGFLSSELVRTSEENNISISIPLNNVDMELLTPNKRFIVRIEDLSVASVYNGVYKLHHMVYGFDRDGSENSMLLYAICEFKLFKKA